MQRCFHTAINILQKTIYSNLETSKFWMKFKNKAVLITLGLDVGNQRPALPITPSNNFMHMLLKRKLLVSLDTKQQGVYSPN